MHKKYEKWTKSTIYLAFENFIDEYGRLPTTREMDKLPQIPCRNVLKTHFNMTSSQFFRQNLYVPNVPRESIVIERQRILETFRNEYIRLGCPTLLQFNKNRKKGIVSALMFMKKLDCTWNELVYMAGFNVKTYNKFSRITTNDNRTKMIVNIVDYDHEKFEYAVRQFIK